MGQYTLTTTVDLPLEEADPRVREALMDEGFGVLTEIDVQSTLQQKLGEDIGPYRILGACNPPLAHQAIQADADIGALLPCNVVLRATASGTTDVVAADPEAMLAIASGSGVQRVAAEAKERLERALERLAA